MRDNFSDSIIMNRKSARFNSRPKVTIAIGFISNGNTGKPEQVVLACESQTSYQNSKDFTAKKLHEVKFANMAILVANAGWVRESKRAIATMQEKAKGVMVESPRTIIEVIEEAMEDTRKSLCRGESPSQERELFLELDHAFDLLIGFVFDKTPYLYHVSLAGKSVNPVEQDTYAAIGTGEDLARYLIKEYQQCDPGFVHYDQMAVSIIEKVKQNVPGCDGPTRVGAVYSSDNSPSVVDIFDDERRIDFLVNVVKAQEQIMAKGRASLIQQSIEDTNRKLEKWLASNPEIKVKIKR